MEDTAIEEKSICIVGAGTFGLSTALELSLHGYKQITVLDRASSIPSPFSAGCDLNKILRAEYQDPFYTDLALQAFEAWRSPFFSPYHRESGLVIVNSANADQRERDVLSQSLASIRKHPRFPAKSLTEVNSGEHLRSVIPSLKGPMEGWSGYLNATAGYARAAKAMQAMFAACQERGVRFILGEEQGQVTSLVFDDKRCTGVTTKTGTTHSATHTILCLGAHVGRILPSIQAQIVAKAWSVAHLQLSPVEARDLAGIPVINCRDLGFFFEPDPDTGLVKLCAHSAGVTNYSVEGKNCSVPPLDNSQLGHIPEEDETKLRKLVASALPQFSDRPFIQKFICWCGDTSDSNYIIDFVPGTSDRSLLVFSGDSGHAFKMLPIAGKWARDVLEGGCQELPRWRWKQAPEGDIDDIHWRPGALKDLKDIVDWV